MVLAFALDAVVNVVVGRIQVIIQAVALNHGLIVALAKVQADALFVEELEDYRINNNNKT